MKKTAALAGWLLLLTTPGVFAADGPWVATVKHVEGLASIERDGNRQVLGVGTRIKPGDVILTEASGAVAITTVEETRIAVGAKSRVVIESFVFNPTTHEGSLVLAVLRGVTAIVSGFIAKASPEAMQVRTPTSQLGIRGTEFIVEVAARD